MTNALRLTMDELTNLRDRIAGRATLNEMRDKPAERKKRDSKYGNTQVVDAGIKFDSKAEHKRWEYLVMLEKAGEIRDLKLQVPFLLIPSQVRPSGGLERPTTYLADFSYLTKDGVTVVEDVKGVVTPEFRLKRKLMLFIHGVEVKEVRS